MKFNVLVGDGSGVRYYEGVDDEGFADFGTSYRKAATWEDRTAATKFARELAATLDSGHTFIMAAPANASWPPKEVRASALAFYDKARARKGAFGLFPTYAANPAPRRVGTAGRPARSQAVAFAIGSRVELHPGTSLWMMGDRYGEVVGATRDHRVKVKLDRSGRTKAIHPDNLTAINPAPRRVGTSTRAPSMITRRKPSKRLIRRRRKNVRRGYYPNPAPGVVDRPLAHELALFVENDALAYHTNIVWIAANLAQKKVKGTYDDSLAIKAWVNAVNLALPRYRQANGFRSSRVSMATKVAAATEIKRGYDEMVDEFATQIRGIGNTAFRKSLSDSQARWASSYRRNPLSSRRKDANARVRLGVKAMRHNARRGDLAGTAFWRRGVKGALAARRANPRSVRVMKKGGARKGQRFGIYAMVGSTLNVVTNFAPGFKKVELREARSTTGAVAIDRILALKLARMLAAIKSYKVAVVSLDTPLADVKAALA